MFGLQVVGGRLRVVRELNCCRSLGGDCSVEKKYLYRNAGAR